jgi:methionyl-tRNA synthetase
MITRYFRGEVPYPSAAAARTKTDENIGKLAAETISEFDRQWKDFQFSRALETAWGLVSAVDRYIVETQPWAVAEKNDDESRSRLGTILYTAAEALRIVTALAHPVVPESTAKIWAQLGLGNIAQARLDTLAWGQLHVGTKLGKVEPVFPRADKSTIERMQQMEVERGAATIAAPDDKKEPAGSRPGQGATQAAVGATAQNAPAATVATPAPATSTEAKPTITIDDFAKVELRVAQVKFAERVKGADKLMRLEIDLGYEQRQIVAGIAKAYDPEKLIGRKIVIVANLQPRKLRGLESNGMLLAASIGEDGQPVLAGFLEDVPVGAKLK